MMLFNKIIVYSLMLFKRRKTQLKDLIDTYTEWRENGAGELTSRKKHSERTLIFHGTGPQTIWRIEMACSAEGELVFWNPKKILTKRLNNEDVALLEPQSKIELATYGIPAKQEMILTISAHPQADNSTFREFLKTEAECQNPYPSNICRNGLSLIQMNDSSVLDEWELMFFSTRLEAFRANIRTVTNGFLKRTKVRSCAAALINTVALHQKSEDQSTLVILDLGDTTLLVFHHKGYFARALRMGSNGTFDRNYAKRLASEVVRTINFYRCHLRGDSPARCYYCSDNPCPTTQMEFLSFFAEHLNIPCHAFDPRNLFQVVTPDEETELLLENPASTSIAIGHALAEYLTCPVDFDYIIGKFSNRKSGPGELT